MSWEIGTKFDREYRNKLNTKVNEMDADRERIESEINSKINSKDSAAHSRITQVEQDRITRDNQLDSKIDSKESESIQRDSDLDTRIDNIVSQAGTDNTEIVDMRLGADGIARTVAGDLMREIHEQQLESNQQKKTLTHGLNIIESDTASPLKVEFYGRTLVNLLGDIGNFEKDSNGDGVADGFTYGTEASYSLVTDNVKHGTKAQRIYSLSGDTSPTRRNIAVPSLPVSTGKYYLIAVDAITDGTSVAELRVDPDGEPYFSGTNISKTLYIKINPTSGKTISIHMYNKADVGVESWVQYDGLRLYEIDKETYDKIGVSLNDADVERLFPYVDSVQHVKNPVVKVAGANLVHQFADENRQYIGASTANFPLDRWSILNIDTIKVENKEIKVPSVSNIFGIRTKTSIGQAYTIQFEGTENATKMLLYINGAYRGVFARNGNTLSYTITATTNETDFMVRLEEATAGDKVFKNPMISLGSQPKVYTDKNDSYLYAETVLAGLPNSDKKDILYRNYDKSRWEVQRNFEPKMVLDGSGDWQYESYNDEIRNNCTAVKLKIPNAIYSSDGVLYNETDGKYYTQVRPYDNLLNADEFNIGNGEIFINISDSDATGYDLTTTAGIQAYFADKNYFLSYQLAEPVTEVEGIDFPYVEGDLSIQGDAQVEVGELMVFEEEVSFYYESVNKRYLGNHLGESNFNHRVNHIVKVYENGVEFNKFSINPTQTWSYGNERLVISEDDFNPNATYTATYSAINDGQSTHLTEVKASFSSSLKSSFARQTEKVSDIATEVSIHARQIYDLMVKTRNL